MNYWTQSAKNIFVAAHRGFSEKYPENTMLAFEKALALGLPSSDLAYARPPSPRGRR